MEGELISKLKGNVKYHCVADYYPCYDVASFLESNQENRKESGNLSLGEDSDLKAVVDLTEFWKNEVIGFNMTYKEALSEILRKSGIEDFRIPMKLDVTGSGDLMGTWDAVNANARINHTDANGRPFKLDHIDTKIGIETNVYLYGIYEFELVSKPGTQTEIYGYYLNKDLVLVKIDKELKNNYLKFKKIIKSYSTPYAFLPPIGEE